MLANETFAVLIEDTCVRASTTDGVGKLYVPRVPAGDHCVEIAGYYFHMSALNYKWLSEPIPHFALFRLGQEPYADSARLRVAEFRRRCREGFDRGR